MRAVKTIYQIVWHYASSGWNGVHASAYAAQAAYFIMLSFIPIIMLLLALLKYTPVTQSSHSILLMSSSSKVFGNILNSFNTVSFPINAAGSFSIGTYPVGYRIFPFLFLYFVTSETSNFSNVNFPSTNFALNIF